MTDDIHTRHARLAEKVGALAGALAMALEENRRLVVALAKVARQDTSCVSSFAETSCALTAYFALGGRMIGGVALDDIDADGRPIPSQRYIRPEQPEAP